MRYDTFNPRYLSDDSDFNTNADSYYKDLARKQKLFELLANKILEYDQTLEASLEEIQTVLKNYSDILDGKIENFDKIIFDLVTEWIDENLEDIFTQGTKLVWFGLTDDGYFMAVIPPNWSEIIFDTSENGELILTY